MSLTVLLVDDEPRILAALRRTLRAERYRILTTSDPTEVLTLIEKEHVDVLISDIDMPEMSGAELVSLVRNKFPMVVRILLTGRGSLDSAMKAINDGEVFRYLTKPWDELELRSTIAQAAMRLEELRRVAAADQAIVRRDQLRAELEREHPGISTVVRVGGVYLVAEGRLVELEVRFRDSALGELMES